MIDAARASILRAQITALEAIEVALVGGQTVASHSYDGNSLSYTQARLPDLQMLLAQKRRELRSAEGSPIRPMRFRA